MIATHNLDNIAQNDTTAYALYRYNLIRAVEGVEHDPYLDSSKEHNPTIGS
jgi:hypothetical protein